MASPNKADSHEAHGAPLGEEEVRLTKAAYGWPENEKFLVPGEVLAHFRQGIGCAAKSSMPNGPRCSPATRPSIPNWPRSSN